MFLNIGNEIWGWGGDGLCVPVELLYKVAREVEFEVGGRVEEGCACTGERKGQVWICGLTLLLGKGALGRLPLVVGRGIVTEPADEVAVGGGKGDNASTCATGQNRERKDIQIFSAVCLEYEIVLKVLESDGRQVSSLWL